MDILNDTMTPQEIKDIKESIGALALLKNSPLTFVVEWVQDTRHAEKIRKIFDINGIDMLFQ
jgi:hypothetical protein